MFNSKNSFYLVQRRIFTYCDSCGFHAEPSSAYEHDLMLSEDLVCLPLDWLLAVSKQRPIDVAQVQGPSS